MDNSNRGIGASTPLSDHLSQKYIKQKEEQQDELNYLSGLAFEQFGFEEKELDKITQTIDKKIIKGNQLFTTIFISLLIGLFIGVSVFFVIFNKSKNHASVYQELKEENEALKQSLNNKVLAQDTVFNIVQHKEKKTNEHFATPDVLTNETKPFDDLGNLTIKEETIPFAELELKEEQIPTYIPNAPVIFISNLKVANYRNYYFKQNDGIDLSLNTGLSAQYENVANLQKTQRNRNSKYYAHLIIQRAMNRFSQKQVEACIVELQMLYDYNKQDANAQFYLGMCYMEKQQYAKALGLFENNLENEINIFHQEAEYYKAYCLLETKQIDSAKALLLQIKNNKGFYSERVAELLKNK